MKILSILLTALLLTLGLLVWSYNPANAGYSSQSTYTFYDLDIPQPVYTHDHMKNMVFRIHTQRNLRKEITNSQKFYGTPAFHESVLKSYINSHVMYNTEYGSLGPRWEQLKQQIRFSVSVCSAEAVYDFRGFQKKYKEHPGFSNSLYKCIFMTVEAWLEEVYEYELYDRIIWWKPGSWK